jgi:hypothetical protein
VIRAGNTPTENVIMRRGIPTIPLIAMMVGLTVSSQGQLVVWQDDFDLQPVGANSADATYGRIAYNFAGAGVGNPLVMITNGNPSPFGTSTNYCAFIFDSTNTAPPLPLNFGWDINSIATTSNNTNTALQNYTLEFDIAVQGDGINNLGGFVGPILYIYGHSAAGSYSSGQYYGNGAQTNLSAGWFPAAGAGWTHVEIALGGFGTANAGALNTTSAAFSFGIGAFMAGLTSINRQEIDIANVQIVMNTNPPAIPPPTMNIVRAQPGLRIFAQDSTAPWNQEGFGTVNLNQSWVGIATPANPVSYSVTIASFDTVDNYALYAQFVQNGNPGDPFGVYNGANALAWTIQKGAGGFSTRIDWKTNAPAAGQNNNALPVVSTTSTNGRGTWTLTFTNDTDGTVSAPDGTTASFTLPPEVPPYFANPCIIDFGTAPNNAAGYGQWIDISKVAISNVVDGTQYDDFTQNEVLNTSLWNPAFSLNNNPPSVIQVSTNTSFWMNWTTPDDGFGLGTKADLGDPNVPWYTPGYYGNGVTNSTPTKMGTVLKWTLIPNVCLPTTDGTVGGPASTKAFFSLQKPPLSQ